jgi:hypothetical protein
LSLGVRIQFGQYSETPLSKNKKERLGHSLNGRGAAKPSKHKVMSSNPKTARTKKGGGCFFGT